MDESINCLYQRANTLREQLQPELQSASDAAAVKSYTRAQELPKHHKHGGRIVSLKKQMGDVGPQQEGLKVLFCFL